MWVVGQQKTGLDRSTKAWYTSSLICRSYVHQARPATNLPVSYARATIAFAWAVHRGSTGSTRSLLKSSETETVIPAISLSFLLGATEEGHARTYAWWGIGNRSTVQPNTRLELTSVPVPCWAPKVSPGSLCPFPWACRCFS